MGFSAVVITLLVLLTGCNGASSGASGAPGASRGTGTAASGMVVPPRPPGERSLRVAEQHGLAYLPLAVMQVEGYMPEVQWVRTGNATVIREAMLAGHLDIGFMGIPPFLIGEDRGTEWEAFTGLSEAPLGLVTLRQGYRSLEDLQARDRIAVPQPGSIQHILLAMAAERVFGNPRHFDDQLVSMGHPEGYTALLARRDLAAHFTAPPYLFLALEEDDATLLLHGNEAFGGRFTFIIGVHAPRWGTERWQADHRENFLSALDRAMEAVRVMQAPQGEQEEEEARRLIAALAQFYQLDAPVLQGQIRFPGTVYSREIRGLEQFREQMTRFGYLTP